MITVNVISTASKAAAAVHDIQGVHVALLKIVVVAALLSVSMDQPAKGSRQHAVPVQLMHPIYDHALVQPAKGSRQHAVPVQLMHPSYDHARVDFPAVDPAAAAVSLAPPGLPHPRIQST